MSKVAILLIAFLLASCGGGRGGGSTPTNPIPSRINISVSGASNGIFDPAPVNDGSGTLWMSFSVVDSSSNDPILPHISTRIASSTDDGLTWNADSVLPNTPSDLQVPDGSGGTLWATWHFEVSRLAYDANAVDPNQRWKMFWHRYLEANVGGTGTRLFEHGWIGASTAPSPTGPWSPERKLFVGAGYDTNNNSTIGIPEYDLAALFPSTSDLGSCIAFTEPGIITNSSGVYISLKCATSGSGKVVLIKCDNELTSNSCTYIGDFIDDSEAAQFAPAGQSFSGFSATELIVSPTKTYLMLTPTESPGEIYRGCLVFEVEDLDSATLARSSNVPALTQRIEGVAGSFNGACGYVEGMSASGVIYSEHNDTAPQFRLFASKIRLPK